MKLLRYGPMNDEKPGLLDDQGRIRDLSDHVPDINGSVLAPDRLVSLGRLDPATLPLVESSPRLGPPVAGVGKIIAVGLNYADHAVETGADLPSEPLIFSKAVTSLSGPCDPVMLPKNSTHTDWEVELAIIMGRRAQYVSAENAFDY
ncbi:MAG TPA: 2-hydroxyhepta-2,4-diene-1,7-dioate isomerase, partial [Rhodospirillales bacterium]|nr:2-hydroxyhepta-2,4-diene-1,7-dioate isomerase [Rhodospirillales bacterium]